MSYVYPTSTTNVSDSFGDHVDRGSVNPGTDYTAAYGSPVYAAAGGVIQVADDSIDGGGGRVMNIAHDDGTGTDYLHLSAIEIYGGRVSQGQLIAFSGASGYGDEWYYGAHLHISCRPNHTAYFGDVGNQDFDAIMRTQKPPAPPKKPDIMKKYHFEDRRARTMNPGVASYLTDANGHGKNIVGNAGAYSITAHLGASKMIPGDLVQLALLWDDNKGKQSFHYTEWLTADRDGKIAASVEFKRSVDSGFSVYVWFKADPGNAGPLSVDYVDADAYLFTT